MHGYKTLQHWNHWLTQEQLGTSLLQAEEELLSPLLAKHFGKHTLLIGVPHQHTLLRSTVIPLHSLVSPLFSHEKYPQYHCIESDLHELPILTGSVDLVMLPHTLEFIDYPRQLLAEACRIIKPEGLIAVCGFNPYSAWGIQKFFTKNKHRKGAWEAHAMPASIIESWLHLADFDIETHKTTFFRPPLRHQSLYQKLHFLESMGRNCFPYLGGIYVVLARAKVIPLTPIKMQWKQKLGGLRISTTISGHIARAGK